MSQHDYNIANSDGATVRADINSALQSLAECSSGATAPSTTFAYQWWADTANDLLKQRNAANSGWISVLTLSTGAVTSGGQVADDTSPTLGGTLDADSNDITNTGDVGIGTASPSHPLHSVGASATSEAVRAYNVGGSYPNAGASLGCISNEGAVKAYNNGGTETIRIHSNGNTFLNGGNVGIGDASPNEKLHVEGDGVFGASNSGSGSTLGVYGNLSVGSGGGGGYAATAAPSDGMIVSGKVGIGTTSPSNKLEVNGGSTAYNSGSAALSLFGTSDKQMLLGYDESADAAFIGALDPAVAWKNIALVMANVGIGTTSPIDKLVVAGNTRIKSADGRLVGKNDDSAYSIGSSGGAAIRFIIDGTNDEIAFETHKTAVRHAESMRISSSGYLGIGTATPGQILDVNSGSGNAIADGWSTHSLAVYKEDIEDASGYLAKVVACPAQTWRRKPFVSADEIKDAVLNEFGDDVLVEEAVEAKEAILDDDGNILEPLVEAKEAVFEKRYSAWDDLFPDEASHRNKALYNMPDGELKTWIDNWCESKRVEMRPEVKWQKKQVGLVADAELTAKHLPEVISINDEGDTTGIDTMAYIGVLHNAIQELSAKVAALEAKC